jgi:hypothetical protein
MSIRFCKCARLVSRSNRMGIAAMPTTDAFEGYAGLQQWAQPLIFDRLCSAYRKIIRDERLARGMTRMHARVWRALVNGDMEEFGATREALVVALTDCSLTLDHLADVDAEIMVEMLDVVMARYNRSHRAARPYHLALLELAGLLSPSRAAA